MDTITFWLTLALGAISLLVGYLWGYSDCEEKYKNSEEKHEQ